MKIFGNLSRSENFGRVRSPKTTAINLDIVVGDLILALFIIYATLMQSLYH
jgi:hypothetical protein